MKEQVGGITCGPLLGVHSPAAVPTYGTGPGGGRSPVVGCTGSLLGGDSYLYRFSLEGGSYW